MTGREYDATCNAVRDKAVRDCIALVGDYFDRGECGQRQLIDDMLALMGDGEQ
jgi:hypothetical protein